MFEALRDDLLARARRDLALRSELAKTGALFVGGYHPQMEALHVENAEALNEAFDEAGWPDRGRFGDEGAAAAFIILQHAISRPDIQRRGLTFLVEAAERGDASLIDAAHLADRIAVLEGRPQQFGTQFDWDERGELSPAPLAEPHRIEEIRAEIGLPPLAESLSMIRARAAAEGEMAPPDLAQRKRGFDEWARRVGWRA